MTTYRTENPIGSVSVKDLFDNAENLDQFANSETHEFWDDRLGKKRKTWHGIENQANIQIDRAEEAADISEKARDDATAAAGAIGPIKFYDTYRQAELDLPNLSNGDLIEIAKDEKNDSARTRYRVIDRALKFVVNLDLLRVDLSSSNGANFVWFQGAGEGSYSRSVQDALLDRVNIFDYIPRAEHLRIFSGISDFDASECLRKAAAQSIKTGKGLCSPYFRKLFCASSVDLSRIRFIDIPGDIQMGAASAPATLTVGGLALGGTANISFGDVTNGTSVVQAAPPERPVFRIFGLKSSEVTIGSCNYTQVFADPSDPNKNSTAYNDFYLNGVHSKFEITDILDDEGVGGAWVNENKIKSGRIIRLHIIGVGYPHNHNSFDGPTLEGQTVEIVIKNASHNIIDRVRAESVDRSPGINFDERSYANSVILSWSAGDASPRNQFSVQIPVIDKGKGNIVTTEAITLFTKTEIFSVGASSGIIGNSAASACANTFLSPPANSQFPVRAVINPSLSGFSINAINRVIAMSDFIPVKMGDVVSFSGDFEGARIRPAVWVYDENMQPLVSEGSGGSFYSQTSSMVLTQYGYYTSSSDVTAAFLNSQNGAINRPEVKFIRVFMFTGTNAGFYRSLGAKIYTKPVGGAADAPAAATPKYSAVALAGAPTRGFAPFGTRIFDTVGRREMWVSFAYESRLAIGLQAGAVTASISTISTVASGDIVGILLTDGTTHWSAISAVDGTTITIAPIPAEKQALIGARAVFNRWAI